MHRLGTQHCVAMGSPPIPGRSVRSAPDTASMTEPLVIGDLKLFEPIAMCPLVTLRDHEKRGPSLFWLRRQVARTQPDWPTRAPR